MTQIQRYLSDTGMTQTELATLIGISRGHMSEITSGKKTPGLALAIAIERATNGAVPVMSWEHHG